MARRDTRELILATSLVLFNEQGESNVSTNQIALEADISPGNLYYHFRSKDEIALELFKHYLLQMQPMLEVQDPGAAADVAELCLRLHLIYETMAQYRFLYRDLADLHARMPVLRHAMNGLLGRQREALKRVATRLREAQVLDIGDERLAVLTETALSLMTFWIPFAEITAGHGHGVPARAVAFVLHLYLPYLAEAESKQVERLAREYLDTDD